MKDRAQVGKGPIGLSTWPAAPLRPMFTNSPAPDPTSRRGRWRPCSETRPGGVYNATKGLARPADRLAR